MPFGNIFSVFTTKAIAATRMTFPLVKGAKNCILYNFAPYQDGNSPYSLEKDVR